MPAPPAPPETLAIVNARVWTGDARRPWADALLVQGHQITAVGSSAEVKKRAGPALVVDAKGMMVVPMSTESRVGTIAPGQMADLIVLERHITRVAPDAIRDAGIVLTVSAGRIVYDRDGLTH
jgi:hypothetical protein